MGVARISTLVAALLKEGEGRREGARYPPHTPIAIIERASCPDQRVVASTLEGIVEVLERNGEQRVPGMMLIGWAALALEGQGDLTVLDDGLKCAAGELDSLDKERIQRWLGGDRGMIREGLDDMWKLFAP